MQSNANVRNMETMSQITEILNRLRKAFSQTELSKETGISQSKFSRWEAGRIPAGVDDAFRLKEFADAPSTRKRLRKAEQEEA